MIFEMQILYIFYSIKESFQRRAFNVYYVISRILTFFNNNELIRYFSKSLSEIFAKHSVAIIAL